MNTAHSFLAETAQLLSNLNVHVVGGAVRDRLLGRAIYDFDLILPVDPTNAAKLVAEKLGGSYFPLDAERGILRVAFPKGFHFDFACYQGPSFEADIDRRDFSVNALTVPLSKWANPAWKKFIIDRHNGLQDLAHKKIVPLSGSIFHDDPLRLLRAFRIAAELDFQMDASALKLISREKNRLRKPSPERIRVEMLKIFSTPRAYDTLVLMDKTGVLDVLLPEAKDLRRTAPSYYGKGGVLKHTLESVREFEIMMTTLAGWFPRSHRKVLDYLMEEKASFPRLAHCKWALVLHDLGKPDTAKMMKGRLRFFEHEHVGAAKIPNIARRFRWSSDEAKSYARLVENHMRAGNLATQPQVTDKAIHRYFRDLGEDGIAMLLVSLADHLTYLTPKQKKKRNSAHERVTLKMIQRYFHQKKKVVPPKILTGYDVMKAFRLKPSPLIGRLLEDLSEAQTESNIETRDQAINYLKGRVDLHRDLLEQKG